MVKVELVVSPPSLRATFTTTFRSDDKLGIWLPAQMQEQIYANVELNARRLGGTADYTNYRRLAVTTEEKIR